MFWHDHISTETGPYKVLLKRGEFTDSTRQNDDGSARVVPFKIYYPATDDLERVPVILWSHGFGGSRDGAAFLARYVASYGYILVHMTHVGTDSSLWEGKSGHPWEVLQNTTVSRSTTLNRYRDVSFVVGELPDWGREHDDVGRLLDFSRIGICGHSFGSITTQVTAGQLTPDEDGALISMKETQFKAGIAYSPVPGTTHLSGHEKDEEGVNIYGEISTPLLHMTGTEDDSPMNGLPYESRLKVYEQTQDGVPKALLVKQGGDHMVYNGTRGQLKDNPLRPRHEDIVKVISLAWWDYWLKSDEAAKSWMIEQGVQKWLGDDARFEFMA